jgi:multiple antibiotic resistance protein
VSIVSAALLLLLVMDPFGNIPLFLSALKRVDPRRQRLVVARELLIALVVLVIFLFGGRALIDLLGISESALTLAGSIVLFLIALRMVFPGLRLGMTEESDGEPFVVPLAVPLVAGPSSMATITMIMSREPARWPEWLLALGIAWLATSIVLLASQNLQRLLGRRGLVAMERLMGMLLTAIAVQMFVDGLTEVAR